MSPVPVTAGDISTIPRHQATMSMANGQIYGAEWFACRRLPPIPPEKNLRTRLDSTSPKAPLVRSASRGPLVKTVVPTNNPEDGKNRLELARAGSVIQTRTSEIAHMGRAQRNRTR